MRLAIYFLAFFTVVLSCIPCQDKVLRFSYEQAVTIKTDADHRDQGGVDLCSPFCICACCAGITLQQPVPSLPKVACTALFNGNAFAYTAESKGRDLASIWQPPRI